MFNTQKIVNEFEQSFVDCLIPDKNWLALICAKTPQFAELYKLEYKQLMNRQPLDAALFDGIYDDEITLF